MFYFKPLPCVFVVTGASRCSAPTENPCLSAGVSGGCPQCSRAASVASVAVWPPFSFLPSVPAPPSVGLTECSFGVQCPLRCLRASRLGPEVSAVPVGCAVFVFPVPRPPAAGTASPWAASLRALGPASAPVTRWRSLRAAAPCPCFGEKFLQEASCFFLASLRGF